MKVSNNYDATDKLLKGVAISTWTIVIIMVIWFVFTASKASANVKVQTPEAVQARTATFKAKSAVPAVVKKSIGICNNEFIAVETANAVYEASKKNNIPCYVIYSIISTESSKYGTSQMTSENFMDVNYKARSNCDCRGLMQVSIYALNEYNNYFGTSYTMEDLWDIRVNILIGTWYYSQFRSIAEQDAAQYGISVWTVMYVIYNVGPGAYFKVNYHSFYNWNADWVSGYHQRFFFLNNMCPPTDSAHGLYGKNKLPFYGSKNRFERCLELCEDHFFN